MYKQALGFNENLEFKWDLEHLEDGWVLIKNPNTGYLLSSSQCGEKLFLQGKYLYCLIDSKAIHIRLAGKPYRGGI